jgi:hypothetical protein
LALQGCKALLQDCGLQWRYRLTEYRSLIINSRVRIMRSHSGGCSCGAVRFSIKRFLYVLACHCDACKKRTGSAFGLSVPVEVEDISVFSGKTTTYIRTAESGRNVCYEFCPGCGTTVRWSLDRVPDRYIFAAGTFDTIHELKPAGEMYTAAALSWARLGCELERAGLSDDSLKKAMIERTRSMR